MTAGPGRRWLGRTFALGCAALLAVGCGSVEPLGGPEAGPATHPRIVRPAPEPVSPAGSLTVAIPAEPTRWLVPDGDDLASLDLTALWSLPLYRVDDSGQPVPGFALDHRLSADGRVVEIDLAEGEWSDGAPVVAEDVVATVGALRGTGLGHELDVVEDVVALDDRTVRLELEHPTVRWQLLLGPTGVLPAHVLAEGGLEALADLEVTGGPFRLVGQDAGLGATFAAHPASALGAPSLEELRVLVVPSYDVALGLLADERLDAALGYLAIGAVRRAERLGFEAAAPLGGSWVGLRWRAGGPLTHDARQGAAAVIDVSEQVEGLGLGEQVQTPLFIRPAPELAPVDHDDHVAELASITATLVTRADEEALSLTGRLVEAQLRGQDANVQLRRERTPADVEVARDADGALFVRRDPPRPDLSRDLPDELHHLARRADAAPSTADTAVGASLAAATEDPLVLPLYRPPVAHVWRSHVRGIVPSAWPGIGFTSAARWTSAESG